ncbi:MAG: hypothetical protein M1147_07430 [Nitrospirae bacterium]|nr:hypothetical protein [Nitrospirota bacterium]MCL5977943.1 hypothetical protein [Nitrospirota bacterium]
MAKTAKQIAAERAAKQQANLDAIIKIAKDNEYSVEEAYMASWIAKAESNIGINVTGKGTISGPYQYGNPRWEDRFAEYGRDFGFDNSFKYVNGKRVFLNTDDLNKWMSQKNDLELQTKVFLKDIDNFQEEFNNGNGVKANWIGDGTSEKKYAKDALEAYGLSWTLENYIYLRHNTDLREVMKVELLRLLDRDGWYGKSEQSVESGYGQQITDPYDNSSLTPLIKILSETLSIDINGLSNKEAVEKIRASMKALLTTKELNNLLDCLSGMGRCDIVQADKAIAKVREAMGPINTATRRDPLMVDLDGDGIETTNVKDGAYFDHDGNGFAEQTGLVSPDDGILVMDRNGDGIINDGKELFGDQTIMSNGQRAANGFEALREQDSNADGKIDANDSAWSQIKVWQDVDGDGYSTVDELKTLDEVGIKSINLTSTPNTVTDSEGNTQTRTGSFEKTDGTTGIVGEYNLQRDTAYTIANEWLDVPEDIAALPDLQGYGNVYDLQQAIVRDTNGQLKSLVEQFASAIDTATRNSLMEQILFKWTNSDGIDPNSRGSNIDARKLAVLEKFFGQTFTGTTGSNPHAQAIPFLSQSYKGLYEMFYSQLMAQTHLKDLYGAINYTWDDATQSVKGDLSTVATELQNQLTSDAELGKTLLGEFSRTIRGFGAQEMVNYLNFRETFITQDPSLGWIIDSAGLPVYERQGTDNTEAVRGSLIGGNGYIAGGAGNDVVYGTDRDENLSNKSGWYIDRNGNAISGDAIMVGGEVMNVFVERELVSC